LKLENTDIKISIMRIIRDNRVLRSYLSKEQSINQQASHEKFSADDDNTHSTGESDAQIKSSSSVWYRHFLQPVAYLVAGREQSPEIDTEKEEAFSTRPTLVPFQKVVSQRQSTHPIGILLNRQRIDYRTLHAAFRKSHRQYSPILGLVFTYNNFVRNLYHFGGISLTEKNETTPADSSTSLVDSCEGEMEENLASALVLRLFHMLPGGAIPPTHLAKNAASHLTPASVAAIFEAWEKAKLNLSSDESSMSTLATSFQAILTSQSEFILSKQRLYNDAAKAESELVALEERDKETQSIRNEIKRIEGDVIKKNKHQIARKAKVINQLLDDQSRGELSPNEEIELESLQREERSMLSQIEQATASVAKLRHEIVNSADFKFARKAVARAQDAIDSERDSLRSLTNLLARSFIAFDILDDKLAASTQYFNNDIPYTTTIILLAYLWQKYDRLEVFETYMVVMNRLGALNQPIEYVNQIIKGQLPVQPQQTKKKVFYSAPTGEIVNAAISIVAKQGAGRRPPVIQFSYVTWAAYSEFPDCGETALRNLINQIVYNPATRKFDWELLTELREKYYPKMHNKLIEFYRRYPDPFNNGFASQQQAVEWIEVVSHLNEGRKGDLIIRYRREKEGKNIASPLRNLLKVVSALFHCKEADSIFALVQIVNRIVALRGLHELKVDITGVKKDGFGTITLVAEKKVTYELQSYKPVHFGFIESEYKSVDSSNDSASKGTGLLAKYLEYQSMVRKQTNHVPTKTQTSLDVLETTAWESLLVPYQLLHGKLDKFLSNMPPHLLLLFADLNTLSERKHALRWTRSQESTALLDSMVRRIEMYREPMFLPAKKQSKEDGGSG
jgi:hypothetical protein